MDNVCYVSRSILSSILILSSLASYGQLSLSGLVQKNIPTEPIPFHFSKSGNNNRFVNGYNFAIDNSSGNIPDRLYSTLQRNIFSHAYDGGGENEGWNRVGYMFRKFALPNSSSHMFAISFGESDYGSTALCILSATGILLDTLEIEVGCSLSENGLFKTKQSRIDSGYQIIVSSITPVSAEPLLSFESFTSFVGQRVDRTYVVNAQGKFEETAVQFFQTQTYTRAYLENKDNDIWEGNEIPISLPSR